jgi:hypothetical protein
MVRAGSTTWRSNYARSPTTICQMGNRSTWWASAWVASSPAIMCNGLAGSNVCAGSSISAPHRGTYVAYAMGNKGAKQMRPGSMLLEDLNRDVAMLERVHFTSIWTPFDLMIVPASSSRISVGQGYICPVALHRWMLRSRRSLDLTTRLLRA